MSKIQLIVIGYAGSEASNFNNLIPYLGEDIVLSVVEYQGRGPRRKEGFYKSSQEMVCDVAEQVANIRNKDMPYAILGYSMGAQNVYELFAQKLVTEVPICTFVAAHEPPDIDCMGKKFSIDDDSEFMEHMKVYGGIDERLLQEPRFARIYLPRMKADFRMLQDYQFHGEYHKFLSDLVVLYCEEDTPYSKTEGWKRFASFETKFYDLGHNHFFFRTHPKEFCSIIKNTLLPGQEL